MSDENGRTWWGAYRYRNKMRDVGPCDSREAAYAAADAAAPASVKHISTGYGSGGAWFDIRDKRRTER